MTFVGVDIGTTRIKALFFDPADPARIVADADTPVVSWPEGDFRDAETIVSTVVDCIDQLVGDLSPRQRESIEGIGVTSLSEEVVLLDRYGRSTRPMPAWYTTVAADRAISEGIVPSFSWSKLAWAHARYGSEASDVAGMTTLNGFVIGRLGAGDQFPIDSSHAARSGFFDVRTDTWQPEIFARTGWNAALLPTVVKTGSIASTLSEDLALRWGIRSAATVVFAGHDHFCGAYAIGVRGASDLYVSAGTSEAHCLIVDELPDTVASSATVGIGRFVDGERFYLHRQLPAGHLYKQWTALLGLDNEAAKAYETDRLLAEPLGSMGATVIPGLDTDARSSLLDLDPASTPHTVLRALLEGLACAALRIDRELIELTGLAITRVVAAGLPSHTAFWQELRGHLTVAPLMVTDEVEAPALGAALLCRKATCGVETAAATLRVVPTDAARSSAYAALYSRFESSLSRSNVHPVTPVENRKKD